MLDKWNPWSKEIPWLTFISHPIRDYIEQLLHEASQSMVPLDEDSYYNLDYLRQIQPRYSIEIFHNRLLEIVNSFQRRQLPIPRLLGTGHSSSVPRNMLIELAHRDDNFTVVHYAPIICENYFNLSAIIFNQTRSGYYRLRLFG